MIFILISSYFLNSKLIQNEFLKHQHCGTLAINAKLA
jgi:hypothetical protein